MKKIFAILMGGILLLNSCASSYKSSAQQADNVQFVSTQMDGSVTVRVSKAGRTYNEALEQAKKLAVRQTIFGGIDVKDNAYMAKPLITEVNAAEKYQNFFNAFFADGGKFADFVSNEDKKAGSDQISDTKNSVRVITTVRVLRSELKQYLIDNSIIKL